MISILSISLHVRWAQASSLYGRRLLCATDSTSMCTRFASQYPSNWVVDQYGNCHDVRNKKIVTRFTREFNCLHPIILPPIGAAAGPKLVAAIVNAGGVGFLGSGSKQQADHTWFADEHVSIGTLSSKLSELKTLLLEKDGESRIGIGVVTSTLHEDPSYFDQVLSLMPRNLWISGDHFEQYLRIVRSKDNCYADENPSMRVFVQVANEYTAGIHFSLLLFLFSKS